MQIRIVNRGRISLLPVACATGNHILMSVNSPIETIPESESRCRVLDAAYPLFVEYGYKSVSMQQVADAVAVNKATLYHHFRNKEAMFAAVVLMGLRSVRAQVADAIARGGSAFDQLTRIASQMFDNTQSDIGRLMTDAQEHLSSEERLTLFRSDIHPWDLYEEIFAAAIRNGELPEIDTSLATSMFIGLTYGQTWARKLGKTSYPLNAELAHRLVCTLFAGLRAASPDPGISSVRKELIPGDV